MVATLAGSHEQTGLVDGVGTSARFHRPQGLVASADGRTLLIADSQNRAIRRLDIITGGVATIAGGGAEGAEDGVRSAARFTQPAGLALDVNETTLYIADRSNHNVRALVLQTGRVTTLAGSGAYGYQDGVGTQAWFAGPIALALTPNGATLFVSDFHTHRLRAIDVATRSVSTVAGVGSPSGADGVGVSAGFYNPQGLAISPSGRILYVADLHNYRVRSVDLASSTVTTLCGTRSGRADGVATRAAFNRPRGLAITSDGSMLFVADFDNHQVRHVPARDTLHCRARHTRAKRPSPSALHRYAR